MSFPVTLYKSNVKTFNDAVSTRQPKAEKEED